ncbi:MAG TPA: transporter substrate-binding domain-containing protein [Candidatus Limnocylindrales bacterium]|jgi:polar amino acid transport system substrate-binding protein
MSLRGRLSLLGVVAIVATACTTGGAATAAPTAVPTAAATPTGSAPASAAAASPSMAASVAPIAGGLLDKVLKAGKLVVSTDPNYAPQSSQKADGTFEGFDIDVATEIAKRLGVTVDWATPDWSVITAGGWSGRWDASVGSMTVTTDRQKVLDFSDPYYYTPAQMAASTASGITTLDGMAGKTVCVGEATTYLDWLQGKKLDFGTLSPTTTPPAGVKVTTQKTDAQCPQLWGAGRNDFEGFLSSSTTVDGAIKAGLPLVKVGDPVYAEPLAVAVDKSGPDPTDFVAAVTQIVQDMHADGTLSAMSTKWFGLDLTTPPTQ